MNYIRSFLWGKIDWMGVWWRRGRDVTVGLLEGEERWDGVIGEEKGNSFVRTRMNRFYVCV